MSTTDNLKDSGSLEVKLAHPTTAGARPPMLLGTLGSCGPRIPDPRPALDAQVPLPWQPSQGRGPFSSHS